MTAQSSDKRMPRNLMNQRMKRWINDKYIQAGPKTQCNTDEGQHVLKIGMVDLQWPKRKFNHLMAENKIYIKMAKVNIFAKE